MATNDKMESVVFPTDSSPYGDLFNTVEYSFDSFLKKIENEELTDIYIQNKILYSGDILTNYDNFINPSTRETFQKLWTNIKFLENFLFVCSNMNISFDMNSVTCINKIAYDYYCSEIPTKLTEKDSQVLELLLMISSVVNKRLITVLTKIMDEESARFFALVYRSSFKKEECVKRVNDTIIGLGISFSVDDIIYIYSKMYDDNFGLLFIHTMTNCGLTEMIKNNKISMENYLNISKAMVDILESMTTRDIEKVLKRYATYISLMNSQIIRFSLKELPSNQYPRIVSMTIHLIKDEEIYIP